MTAKPASISRQGRPAPRQMRRASQIWTHPVARKIAFALSAAVADLCGLALAGVAAHLFMQTYTGDGYFADRVGAFAAGLAALFAAINLIKGDYARSRYQSFSRHVWRTGTALAAAFLCAIAIGFATKATIELSRAGTALFLALGFVAVLWARFALVRWVDAGATLAESAVRRTQLVGPEAEIEAFYRRCPPQESGLVVVSAAVLRGPETLVEDLSLATASARIFRAEDVFILVPWTDSETIEKCINAFLCVPVAIHLGPGPVLDRLAQARIAKTGPIASLAIDRSALVGANVKLKRGFDIIASLAALLLLAPLLAILALAIKLDSKGPVLFRQRRYGFNQEPFRIFKFRSMTTLDDGRNVAQATAQDSRVTRIGRFMRRTNLDELPQLLNVLLGDMSLVGPRPHALAHDQLFQPSVRLYARRHNVKPGITGWAQVNGLRGEVTPETLKARIEHDLYYIDNWSIWLDLWILWRTLASKKAFQNAY
jgi:Undecaprenyl-phosphate glucose phosphotransferase